MCKLLTFQKMTMRGAVLTLYLMALTAHVLGYAIEEDLSESELKVVNGNGRFANGVYKSLAHEEGNILFSPISAHSCLSMLYQGTGGSTKEACATGLQVPEPDKTAEGYSKLIHRLNGAERLTVAIANKVYVSDKNHLKNEFKKSVEEKFKSEVESVDFSDADAALNKINGWVKEKTKEKIPKLLEKGDVTSSTSVILLNAVYFKGTWFHTFHKEDTKTEKFHVDVNTEVDVQMMHMEGNFFTYKDDKDLDAQILQLPYTNYEYSMVIVLPKKENGLADLEAKLVQKDLSKLLEGAQNKEPHISLPKFKIEHSMNLKDPLSEIGLGELFGSSCNLSGMLEETNVQVNKVIQKTFIEVDEIGSTAAAATAISVVGAAFIPEEDKPHFVADHPFVFLLVHKPSRQLDALNVLFYGRVQKPN